MEGTCTYRFPRTELDKPVEIQIGKNKLRVETPENNLSADGMVVHQGNLPSGSPVHVSIFGSATKFEADGKIRQADETGSEIEFTSLSRASRKALDDLIEDLTSRGMAAA